MDWPCSRQRIWAIHEKKNQTVKQKRLPEKIPECWQVFSPTRKETSYSDQTPTFASHSKTIQVVRPIRSPWQQRPPRRTKNDELSIVFFSRVGLRTYQHPCTHHLLQYYKTEIGLQRVLCCWYDPQVNPRFAQQHWQMVSVWIQSVYHVRQKPNFYTFYASIYSTTYTTACFSKISKRQAM